MRLPAGCNTCGITWTATSPTSPPRDWICGCARRSGYTTAEFKAHCADLGVETRLEHVGDHTELVTNGEGIGALIDAGLLPKGGHQ